MADRSLPGILDAAYSGPAVTHWPGEPETYLDRAERSNQQTQAWDTALGDPNAGYQNRLPGFLGDWRKTVSDILSPYLQPVAKAAHESGAGLASNFLGPAAPVLKAMFLTPSRIANLEAAGFVKPGGWRSLDALERARSAAAKGATAPEIWEQYGWNLAGNDPWGRIPGTFRTNDFTVLDTSDLRFSRAGKNATLGDFISGRSADELFAADPRLARTNVDFKRTDDGALNAGASPKTRIVQAGGESHLLADQVPGSVMTFYNMRPADDVFIPTAGHELGHIVNQTSGHSGGPAVPFTGRDMPNKSAISSLVEGAPFHQKISPAIDAARARLQGAATAADTDAARDALTAMSYARNEASMLSNYHNARHEMAAREAQRRIGMGLDEQRQHPPGSVDVFTTDTLPWWSVQEYYPDLVGAGITPKDLEIPRRR